ncbi:MAG: hypothetical protein QM736_19385 [Vicinamibacterales bacterium]
MVATLRDMVIGDGQPIILMAGPCVVESEAHAMGLAEALVDITRRVGIPFIFKASYDKANRTSNRSCPRARDHRRAARAGGNQGDVRRADCHRHPLGARSRDCGRVADVLKIPAFLCARPIASSPPRRTGRVVNIKKGQFLAPADMKHAVAKVTSEGSHERASSPSAARASATTTSWSTCAASR